MSEADDGVADDAARDALDGPALARALGHVDETMRAHRDRLCELDGVIGDADHGVTMATGFRAVRAAVDDLEPDAEPTAVLNAAAKAFLDAVGASAGPLYATAFVRGAASAKGKDALDAAGTAALVRAMSDGVAARGKAELGDKTMHDAWHPAAEAAERAANGDGASVADVLRAAAAAADEGARATVGLRARKGRSAKLGERSVGHMDAGAASASLLLHALAGVDASGGAAAGGTGDEANDPTGA